MDIMRILLIIFTLIGYIFAKGTLAGKKITNQAKIDVNIGGINYTLSSNEDSFVVDQIVDVNLKWQDVKPIDVATAEKQRVLTFILKNEGNGKESISLSNEHNTTSAFMPENRKIYIDKNGDAVFGKEDELISKVELNADEGATLFIVSDIPDANLTADDKAYEILKAKSGKTDTTTKDRPNSVDIVVRKDEDSDSGIYIVRDYFLRSVKSKEIISGDKIAHTGSIIRYKIELSIGGKNEGKIIKDIDFKDVISSDSQYLPDSLKLNDVALSDKVDNDNGYIKDGTVFVHIDKIEADNKAVITFDVKIK